jgi:hypothetical protein
MYAVDFKTSSQAKAERVYEAARKFDPRRAGIEDGRLGIYVAVGGSGMPRTADFDEITVDLTPDAIADHKHLRRYVTNAMDFWPEFVAWMKLKANVSITAMPRLVLTMTETA